MAKILVIHGAGMNMRGKVQQEIFGPMTLPQYDDQIRRYADELGFEVEAFHSNNEGDVIDKFYAAHDGGAKGAIINPAGFTTGYPALVAAIAQVNYPTIEVHVSNPARRGAVSDIGRAAKGVVTGFGIFGYYIAMRGLKELIASPK